MVRAELLAAVGADPDAPMRPVAGVSGRRGDRRDAACLPAPAPGDRRRGPDRRRAARRSCRRSGSALADLAAAALEAALALARADLPDHGAGARLAVIGMGKSRWARAQLRVRRGRDLRRRAGRRASTRTRRSRVGDAARGGLARACSAPSGEPALWPVDAALRPEGKQGPLVRTVASHLAYYERWAKTWEFQALLKARVVAGDREVGRAYADGARPAGVARRGAGELRRGLPGDAAPGGGARPAGGGRPPAQARAGRPA